MHPPTNEELIFKLDQLHALRNLIDIEYVKTAAELDRRRAYDEDGAPSMADWITFRHNTSPLTARKEIQLGHALSALPAVCERASEGLLSRDKVIEIASWASEGDDAEVAERAVVQTYAEVRDEARVARRIQREEAERAINARYLRTSWNHDESYLRINGRIPGADGAAINTILDRLAGRLTDDDPTLWEPLEKRRADALVELANTRLGQDGDTDRATVVIHVDARDLNQINGKAQLEQGPLVPSEVARRLACDGRVEVVTEGPDGKPIGIGRRSRVVPPWMIRELKKRDGGCVNCGNTSACHAHHIIHWAQGGRTDLPNLVLLCWKCHRLVHERRYRLTRDQYGRALLVRPDGWPARTPPTTLRPDVRARICGPPARVG